MSARLAEIRIAERAMFLQAAYEEVEGRTLRFFNASGVAREVGVPEKDISVFVAEMSRRGLLDHLTMGGELNASLSEYAIDAVEQLETLPTPAPSHAETKTIINNPTNCAINIESKLTNSDQSIRLAKEHWIATVGKAGLDLARQFFVS